TYDCVLTNACGSTTSNGAILTMNSAPAVTSQPVSQAVCSGVPVTFSVAGSGVPAPTFQWRRNGTSIPGATGASYMIASVSAGDAGSYDCVLSNACGSATSNAAVLTVNTPPVVTSQPSSQTVCAGLPVTFTVSGSGNPAPAFQWRRKGTAIPGATGPSYT